MAQATTKNGSKDIQFVDNPLVAARSAAYTSVTVNVDRVLSSWKSSTMAFEWLTPKGDIRDSEQLSPSLNAQRQAIEAALADGALIAKPVLGIGIFDNVEIGIGRDVFVTLAAHGIAEMPVHIPRSMERDFRSFVI